MATQPTYEQLRALIPDTDKTIYNTGTQRGLYSYVGGQFRPLQGYSGKDIAGYTGMSQPEITAAQQKIAQLGGITEQLKGAGYTVKNVNADYIPNIIQKASMAFPTGNSAITGYGGELNGQPISLQDLMSYQSGGTPAVTGLAKGSAPVGTPAASSGYQSPAQIMAGQLFTDFPQQVQVAGNVPSVPTPNTSGLTPEAIAGNAAQAASIAARGGTPATVPTQNVTSAGTLTRNLQAEQEFVKSWQGKGGRLPTPDEINQAVYGTTKPVFNTPQGVAPNGGTGTGGTPTTPGQPGGTTPSTGNTALDQFKALMPELQKLFTPQETEEQKKARTNLQSSLDRLVILQEQLSKANAPSDQITALDNQIEQQKRLLDQMTPASVLSARPGLSDFGVTQTQLERMTAAQKEPIARAYTDLLTSRSILARTKQQDVDNIQSQIQGQQQIFNLQEAMQKLAPSNEIPENLLSSLIGSIIPGMITTPQEQQAQTQQQEKLQLEQKSEEQQRKDVADRTMQADGYYYVDTPAKRTELQKQGYDIKQYQGRTYAKAPVATKTTTSKTGSGTKPVTRSAAELRELTDAGLSSSKEETKAAFLSATPTERNAYIYATNTLGQSIDPIQFINEFRAKKTTKSTGSSTNTLSEIEKELGL